MRRAVLATLLVCGCSADEDLYDTFTNAITFEVPFTTQSGTLPAADPSVAQKVTQSQLSLLVVSPGDQFDLPIEWSGGPIVSVDWSFAGSSYFNVPVPNGNSNSAGALALPADLAPDVCDHLAKQCFDIHGVELALVASGGATGSAELAIKLDCSGTHACGGGSSNDLSGNVQDLAMSLGDLGRPRDMARPPAGDMAKGPQDLAVNLDFAVTPDMAVPQDLSTPPDLTELPDLVQTD